MRTSESFKNLAAGLLEVQKKMTNCKRNAENPFFQSTYADLATVLETVRPILSEAGIVITQFAERVATQAKPEDKQEFMAVVLTCLMHPASGEWMQTDCAANTTGMTPQQFGSTVTYLRRYSLMAVCGTAAEFDDDDGNLSSQTIEPIKGKAAKPSEPGNKPITTQERMDALPQDLKDLLSKAGFHSLIQRYQLYNASKGNLDAMRAEAQRQIKILSEKAKTRPPASGSEKPGNLV